MKAKQGKVRARSRKQAKSDAEDSAHKPPRQDDPTALSRNDEASDVAEPGADHTGIDKAKLLQLLLFKMRGYSQKEIARAFNVTDRTIRNWETKLWDLKLDLARFINVDAEFDRVYCRFLACEYDLVKCNREAELRGDHRTVIKCAVELRKNETERSKFLANLGLYSNLPLGDKLRIDPAAEQAEELIRLGSYGLNPNNHAEVNKDEA